MIRVAAWLFSAVLLSSATAFAADSPSEQGAEAPVAPPVANSPAHESDALQDGANEAPPASKKTPATDQPALERDK
jgi:hypothetical protein